jgi:hypothetical protein
LIRLLSQVIPQTSGASMAWKRFLSSARQLRCESGNAVNDAREVFLKRLTGRDLDNEVIPDEEYLREMRMAYERRWGGFPTPFSSLQDLLDVLSASGLVAEPLVAQDLPINDSRFYVGRCFEGCVEKGERTPLLPSSELVHDAALLCLSPWTLEHMWELLDSEEHWIGDTLYDWCSARTTVAAMLHLMIGFAELDDLESGDRLMRR